MSENIAVFAPIPSASVSVTPIVKVGLRRRSQTVYRASCQSASSDGQSHTARASSRIIVSLPIARRAAIRASAGDMPRLTSSCSTISR